MILLLEKKKLIKIIIPIVIVLIVIAIIVAILKPKTKEKNGVNNNEKSASNIQNNVNNQNNVSGNIENQTSTTTSKYDPKKVVEDYEKAFSNFGKNGDTQELINIIDFRGVVAWSDAKGKYNDFIKIYDNINNERISFAKEQEMKYAPINYNIAPRELVKFKDVKELSKDLYLVKAELKGIKDGNIMSKSYVVYKDKIIVPSIFVYKNNEHSYLDQNVISNQNNVSGNVNNQTSTTTSKYDPKKVVEDYVKTVSSYTNSQEILDKIDFRGTLAWIDAKGKYNDFIKKYDTISNDRIKDAEVEESKGWSYGSIKQEIVKYEDVRELGEGLYIVKAELKRDGTPSSSSYYVVYKDKIIVPTTYTMRNDYLSQYF